MSKNFDVERSVVLWHLQACMATFYTQSHPKETNKRKPYQSVQFTGTVYCSHEKLNVFSIAAPIRYFDHLTTIQLEDNRLTHLPTALWHLSGLEKLNLGRNALTELPAGVGLLIGLKELYLHGNQLQSLPSQMGQLVALRVLDVTNNTDLTYLPWEITRLCSLQRLWIEGTCLIKSNNATLQQQIPSLFNMCAQLTGSSFAPTDIGNAGLPLSLVSFLLSEINPLNDSKEVDGDWDLSLARRCSLCQTILYYSGIPLLEAGGEFCDHRLPLLYHVCSQTCRNRWLAGIKQGPSS